MTPCLSMPKIKSSTPQMWATKRDDIKASGADIMAQLSQAVNAQGASPMLRAAVPPHHMHAEPIPQAFAEQELTASTRS